MADSTFLSMTSSGTPIVPWYLAHRLRTLCLYSITTRRIGSFAELLVIRNKKNGLPMTYKVIAVILISCLAGVRKPIYGGLAGMITAPAISIIFNSFDLATVVVLAPFGFGFGLLFGVFSWNIFHGSEYNQQNKKTYYMPISRHMRGGIIYTDEEEKNAKENKK